MKLKMLDYEWRRLVDPLDVELLNLDEDDLVEVGRLLRAFLVVVGQLDEA